MPYTVVLLANTAGGLNTTDQAVANTLVERPASGGPSVFGSAAAAQVNTGSLAVGVSPSQTSSFNITNQYGCWQGNATSGAITGTLPLASANLGLVLEVVKTDSSGNDVNIATSGSDYIEGSTGATAVQLTSQWAKVTLRAIASGQWIKG